MFPVVTFNNMFVPVKADGQPFSILLLYWGHWERPTEEMNSLHTSKCCLEDNVTCYFLSALTSAITKYLITSIIAATPLMPFSISMPSPNYCFGK